MNENELPIGFCPKFDPEFKPEFKPEPVMISSPPRCGKTQLIKPKRKRRIEIMLGNCKYCEYGHQYDNWCELKKRGHKPSGVRCDEYLEAGYLSDMDYGCEEQ